MPYTTTTDPEFISLQKACKRIGISVQWALRMSPHEFPRWAWLGDPRSPGSKRVVSRRQFEAYLAKKLAELGVETAA